MTLMPQLYMYYSIWGSQWGRSAHRKETFCSAPALFRQVLKLKHMVQHLDLTSYSGGQQTAAAMCCIALEAPGIFLASKEVKCSYRQVLLRYKAHKDNHFKALTLSFYIHCLSCLAFTTIWLQDILITPHKVSAFVGTHFFVCSGLEITHLFLVSLGLLVLDFLCK